MIVEILMEEPFEGIFYTRGSYKSAKPPCYFDATGDASATLEIPLDGCKNKRDEKGVRIIRLLQSQESFIFD